MGDTEREAEEESKESHTARELRVTDRRGICSLKDKHTVFFLPY